MAENTNPTEEQKTNQVVDFDLGAAVLDSGFEPEEIIEYAPSNYNFVIGPKEDYQEKYKDRFASEQEFNEFYEYIGDLRNYAHNQRDSRGNIRLTGAELSGYNRHRASFGKSGDDIKFVEANPVYESYYDSVTKRHESLFSAEERAQLNGFVKDETTGQKYAWTPDAYDRFSHTIALKQDNKGRDYWSLISYQDDDLLSYHQASIWGNQEKFGSSMLDPALNFLSTVAVETLQLVPTLLRAQYDITAGIFAAPFMTEDEINSTQIAKTLDRAIVLLEKFKYVPSEDLANASPFDRVDRLFYDLGAGFAYLLPQRWGAKLTSAAIKSSPKLAAKSAKIHEGVLRKAADRTLGREAVGNFLGKTGSVGGLLPGLEKKISRNFITPTRTIHDVRVRQAAMTIGASQPAAGMYREARKNNIDPLDAALLSVAAAIPVYMTERIFSVDWLTKGLTGEAKKIWDKELPKTVAEFVKAHGKDAVKTDAGKLKLLQSVFSKVENGFSKVKASGKSLSGPLAVGRRVVEGGAKEYGQEFSEEMLNALTEIFYDSVYASDKAPGQGAFGTTEKDVWERAQIGGALGAIVGGMTNAFIKGDDAQDKYQEEFIYSTLQDALRGGKESFENTFNEMWNLGIQKRETGAINDLFKDVSGNPIGNELDPDSVFETELEIPGIKDGKITNMADLVYYSYMSRLIEAKKVIEQSGLTDPDIVQAIGGSKEMMTEIVRNKKEALELDKQIKAVTDEMNSLDAKSDEYKTKNEELTKLQGKKALNKESYDDMVKPEKGTKYSKRTNDKIKQTYVATKIAREKTDNYFKEREGIVVDNAFRQTDQYKERYATEKLKNLTDYAMSQNMDENFKKYLESLNSHLETMERAKVSNVEKLQNLVQKLQETKLSKENVNETLTSLRNELESFNPEEMHFDIDPEIVGQIEDGFMNIVKQHDSLGVFEGLNEFDQEYQTAFDSISGMNNTKDSFLNILKNSRKPISGTFAINDDVEVELENGVVAEGTISDVDRGTLEGASEDVVYKVRNKTNGELVSVKSSNLKYSTKNELNEDVEFENFLISNLEKAYNSLDIDVNVNKGRERNISKIKEDVQSLKDMIAVRKGGVKAKGYLSGDEVVAPHISEGEKLIPKDRVQELTERYENLSAGLDNMLIELDKLGAQSEVFNFRIMEAHQKLNTFSLRAMGRYGYAEVFEQIKDENGRTLTDLIADLKDFEVLSEDESNISNERKNSSYERQLKLNKILDLMHRNKNAIIKRDLLEKFLKPTFFTAGEKRFYRTQKESRGQTKYDPSLLDEISNEEQFTSPLYYISTINMLSVIDSISMNDFHKKRKAVLSKDILAPSSFEQVVAEASIVAFLNKGTYVLDKVTALEYEYNKKAKVSDKLIENNLEHSIKDTLMIQGWWGTGKSFQVMPNALAIYQEMFPGEKVDVNIVGISETITDKISKDLGRENRLPNMVLTSLDARKFVNGDIEIVQNGLYVFDEASFLTKSDILKIKETFKDSNAKIIFLGDDSQMIPVNSGHMTRWATEVGLKTIPLTRIYRNDNPMVQKLTSWFIAGNNKMSRGDFQDEHDSIPGYWSEEMEDGSLFGVEYVGREAGQYNKAIVQKFIDRDNRFDKILVFVDHEQANLAAKDFPILKEQYRDRVKILDWSDVNSDFQCVQGLGHQEVYIPIDFQNWKANSSRIVQDKLVWSAGYTAISRSKGFVMIPGPVNMKLKERPLYFRTKETQTTVQDKADLAKRVQNEIDSIDRITFDDSFDPSQTVKEPKVKKDSPLKNTQKKTSTQTEVINDNDYSLFKQNGVISDSNLAHLAELKANNRIMTAREYEMSEFFEKEIKDLLAKNKKIDPKSKPSNSDENVSDEEYNDFKRTLQVSSDRLTDLAIKKKMKIAFSPREEEMIAVSEINDEVDDILSQSQPTDENVVFDRIPKARKGVTRAYEITEGEFGGKGYVVVIENNPTDTDEKVYGKVYTSSSLTEQLTVTANGKNIKSGVFVDRKGLTRVRPDKKITLVDISNQSPIELGKTYIEKQSGKEVVPTHYIRKGKDKYYIANGYEITETAFHNRYVLAESEISITEQLEGIERFSATSQVMREKNTVVAYGTSYTFLPSTAGNEDIDTAAKKKQSIAKHLMRFSHVSKKLIYTEEALYETGRIGNNLIVKLEPNRVELAQMMGYFKDAVKRARGYEREALEEIIKSNSIPEKYAMFMALADTETSYMINGEKQVVLDYDIDLDIIQKMIDEGFKTTSSSDVLTKVDKDNIQLNKLLAKLRHEGHSKFKATNKPVDLGMISDIVNPTDGHVSAYKPTIRRSIKDFKDAISSDAIKPTIKFSEQLYQFKDETGRVRIRLYYTFGETITPNSPYVIFNTPTLAENYGSGNPVFDAKALLQNDISLLENSKWMPKGTSKKVFLMESQNLFSRQLLANNRKYVKGKLNVRKALSAFFIFEKDASYANIDRDSIVGQMIYQHYLNQKNKGARVDLEGISIEKDIMLLFTKMLNNSLAGKDTDLSLYKDTEIFPEVQKALSSFKSVVSEMKTNLHMPTKIETGRDEGFGRPVIDDPLLYTNAEDIHLPYAYADLSSFEENSRIARNDEQDLDSIINDGFDSPMQFYENSTKTPSEVKRISVTQAEDTIRNILGEEFLNNNTEFVSDLKFNGRTLFGMVRSGKIYLDLSKNGIEETTPRHEIFHLVFNYMLSQETKTALLDEARIHLNNPTLSEKAADEWMARKFGSRDNTSRYKGLIGKLRRFFDFVEGIFSRYNSSTPILDDLFNDIDGGRFKNKPISDYGFSEERFYDPEESFDSDEGGEVVHVNQEGSRNSENNKAIINYEKLPSIFGDQVIAVRKELTLIFHNLSYFNDSLTNHGSSFVDNYIKVYQSIQTTGAGYSRAKSSLGKTISEITAADVYNRSLSQEDWRKYKMYQLSNKENYDAFVKAISPSFNVYDASLKKHTDAAHYDKNDFNPSSFYGDVLKTELSITKLRETFNGKLMPWDGISFVSLNEMMSILSDARELTNVKYYTDSNIDYEQTFIDNLKSLAKESGDGTYRANHIHSFLAKFFGNAHPFSSKTEDSYSLRDIARVLSEEKNTAGIARDRFLAINNFLNHINNVNKSLYKKNVASVEVTRRSSRYIAMDNSSSSRIKSELIANIKQAVFSQAQIKTSRVNQMKLGHRDNLFTVTRDGLYWSKGAKSINEAEKIISISAGNQIELKKAKVALDKAKQKLDTLEKSDKGYTQAKKKYEEAIDLVNQHSGGVYLTSNFNSAHLSSMKTFFGLKRISDKVFVSLMKNGEGSLAIIKRNLPKEVNFKSGKAGSEFIAQGFMTMFASMQVNNEMQKAYVTKDETIDELKKKSPYYDMMNSLYRGMGVTEENIDDINQEFANEYEEFETDVKMPKPFDVYPFLDTLAELSIYHQGANELNFFMRPDGTKEYLHQQHSFLTKRFHYGSEGLVNKFDNYFKQNDIVLSKEEFDKLAPEEQDKFFYDGKDFRYSQKYYSEYYDTNGDPLYRLLDKKNPMRINTIRELSGIKSILGTTNPNKTDLSIMIMTSFYDSVVKTSKSEKGLQRLNMTLSNISDKEKVYVAEVEFDSSGRTKLFSVEMNSEGGISNVRIDYKRVFEGIQNKFKQMRRNQQISSDRLSEFISTIREDKMFGPKSFRNLFTKEMEAVWNLDNTLHIEKLNAAFSDAFKALTDEQKEEFKKRIKASSLIDTRDYLFKGKELFLGNAITQSHSVLKGKKREHLGSYTDNVYNATYMYQMLQDIPSDIDYEAELDKLFNSTYEYSKYSKKLIESRYEVPQDVALLLDGPYPIYNSRTKKFNPFFKAHFFANEIFQNEFTPFFNGMNEDYTDSTTRSKRTGSLVTGGSYMSLNVPYGLNSRMKAMVIDDHYIESMFGDKKIKVADGEMIGNPLALVHMETSLGGIENSPTGKGMQKTLLNQVDFQRGSLTQFKHAVAYVSTEMYKENPLYRLMVSDMLRMTTVSAKEEIMSERAYERTSISQEKLDLFDTNTENLLDFDLNNQFEKYYKETESIEESMILLRNWIEERTSATDYIKNNIVWGMQYVSGSKTANNRVNTYDIENRESLNQNFELLTIHNENLEVVLNASQDIEEYKNVTIMNQILSFLGVGSTDNSTKAFAVYEALERIAQLENGSISKLTGENFDKFLREKGLVSLRSSGFVGVLADALNDPEISIQIPNFRTKLVQIFRNHITDRMISQKMFGIRVNQASGYGFLLFEKDGIDYTLSQVERDTNSKINILDAAKAITKGGIYKGYNVRQLKGVEQTEEGITPAEVGASYSYFKNFNLKKGEQVSDVQTVYLTDGKKLLFDDKFSEEEIYAELKKNALLIDFDKTISARRSARTESRKAKLSDNLDEETLIKLNAQLVASNIDERLNDMSNYLYSFNKSLNMYASRVPSSRLGSGSLVKPKFFVQDSANILFIPPQITELNDSDFDIDQLSLYTYSVDNEGQVSNINEDSDVESMTTFREVNDYIIANLQSVYRDSNNVENIFVESNIQDLRNAAENKFTAEELSELSERERYWLEKSNNSASKYNRMNAFSTMLNDYEVNASGKRAIAIVARSLNAMSYLGQMNTSRLTEIAPGFKSFMEEIQKDGKESTVIRVGNYLQAALDNAKELILGQMSIGIYGSALITPMIMDGWSNAKIKAFFSHPAIKNIYNDIEYSDSVLVSKSEYKIFDLIGAKEKSFIPMNESKRMELQAKKIELEAKIAANEIPPNDSQLEDINMQLNQDETLEYLSDLKKLAVKSEALRRFGDIIGTRNGLKVNDFEFERTILGFEQSFGMSLEDFAAGKVMNIEERIEYFKKTNDEYYAASRYSATKERSFSKNEDGTFDFMEMETKTSNGRLALKRLMEAQEFISLDKSGDFYVDANGRLYDRISNVIGNVVNKNKPLVKEALAIGKGYDNVFRLFYTERGFGDNNFGESFKSKYNYKDFEVFASRQSFNDYIDGLQQFAQYLDYKNETPITSYVDANGESRGLILYSPQLGIAGEVDMITISNSGKIKIYDLKSMRKGAKEKADEDYEIEYRGEPSKYTRHGAQLNGYRALLRFEYGFDADISIIPVEVSYNEDEYKSSSSKILGEKVHEKMKLGVVAELLGVKKLQPAKRIAEKTKDFAKIIEDRERDIQKSLDITALTREFPHLNSNINLYHEEFIRSEREWLFDSDIIKGFAKEYIGELGRINWDYKVRRAAFYNQVSKALVAFHLSNHKSLVGRSFNLEIPELEIGGKYQTYDTILSNIHVDSKEGRELFKKQFPEFIDFIKTTIDVHKGQSSRIFNELGLDYLTKDLDSLMKNSFFNRIQTYPKNNKNILILSESMNINEHEMNRLKNDFAKLPKELQDMFAINDFINYSFQYRNGTISEVIGLQYYKDLSQSLVKFEEEISKGGDYSRALGSAIIQHTQHGPNGVPEYSRKIHEKYGEVRPSKIRKRIKLRDKVYVKQIVRYDQINDDYSDENVEYIPGQEIEVNEKIITDPNYVVTTSTPVIKVLSASNLASLSEGLSVDVKFSRGQNYKKGEIMLTETGMHVKVQNIMQSTNEVTFKPITNIGNETEESESQIVKASKIKEDEVSFSLDDVNALEVSKSIETYYNDRQIEKSSSLKIISQIQRIGNFEIIAETNDSVKQKYGNVKARAWVDNQGLHYNIDNIHASDFMHELSHLWYKAIREKNPTLWNELVDEAEFMISSNHPIAFAVKNKFASNNLSISHNVLVEEVVANVAGLASIDSVEKFLLGNGVFQAKEKSFVQKIWNGIKSIFGKIQNFFMTNILKRSDSIYESPSQGLESIRMADLFKNYAQSVFNGEVDSELASTLMDGYRIYKGQDLKVQNAVSDVNFINQNKQVVIEAIQKAQAVSDNIYTIEEMFDDKGNIVYKARELKSIRFSIEENPLLVENDIKEFASLFNSNTTSQQDMDQYEDSRFAHAITSYLVERGPKDLKNKKPVYLYSLGGKEFSFDASLDFDKIKDEVMSKVIPETKKAEQFFGPNIIEFANEFRNMTSEDSLKTIGDKVFGKNRFSESTLNGLVTTLGLNEGFEEIFLYSDLSEEIKQSDATLRSLYSKSFVGYDPLIVIHKKLPNGELDLSIVDVTSKPLPSNINAHTQKNIQGRKEYDSDYYYKGGRFKNNSRDIRKMLLGMTVLKMAKVLQRENSSKSNLRVRNMGVLQVLGNDLRRHMITDIKDVMVEVDLLRKNDKFMRNVTNDEILDILKDDSLYSVTVQQSYVSRLKIYLQHLLDAEGLSRYETKRITDQLHLLNDASLSSYQLGRVLEARKAAIEGKLGLEEAIEDDEYQWLSRALKETKTGMIERINEIRSMDQWEAEIQTAHDLSDDTLQWLVKTVHVTKNIVVEEMRKEQNYMREDFKKMISIYEGVHGSSTKYFKELGSEYFKRLFKTKNIDLNGSQTTVVLPELHWDKNNSETKKLLDNGTLTEEDLAFTNKLLDKIEERWIKNKFHSESRLDAKRQISGESTVKFEEVKNNFYKSMNYRRGMVPMISKSANELLFSGKFKDAGSRVGEVLSNYEILFENDDMGTSLSDISNTMNDQFDIYRRYERVGLNFDEQGLTIDDISKNNSASTNLEAIYNYFMLAGIRQEHYENRVLPVYNSTRAILTFYKSFGETEADRRKLMHYNLKWADEFIDRTVFRRSADTRNELTLPKMKLNKVQDKDGNIIHKGLHIPDQVSVSKVVKGLINATSFATLGYSTGVAFKSALFNEIALITNGLASSISKASKGDAALPGMGHLQKAHQIVLGGGRNFRKAKRIALDLQLINRTERDLLENPYINLTNKNIFQSAYAHLMNWGTDAAARMTSMVAIMIKDGSWDAYEYNEQTGDVTYNERKDKRFYDEEGHKIEGKQAAIYDMIRSQLIEQGSQIETDKGLSRGYDFELVEGTMKWYADKYIIGTMDDMTKPLISNRFIGALFANFRIFSFSRLFNAGVYGQTRKTSKGIGYTAIQDENGEWISQKELLEIEGALQSLNKALNAFSNLKNQSLSEWWNNSSDVTRFNISKTGVQLVLWGLLFGLIKGAWEKDEFAWAYKDIFIAPAMSDVLSGSPIPSFNIISNLVTSSFGGDMEGVLKTFGATRNVVKGIKNINSIID